MMMGMLVGMIMKQANLSFENNEVFHSKKLLIMCRSELHKLPKSACGAASTVRRVRRAVPRRFEFQISRFSEKNQFSESFFELRSKTEFIMPK